MCLKQRAWRGASPLRPTPTRGGARASRRGGGVCCVLPTPWAQRGGPKREPTRGGIPLRAPAPFVGGPSPRFLNGLLPAIHPGEGLTKPRRFEVLLALTHIMLHTPQEGGAAMMPPLATGAVPAVPGASVLQASRIY